MLIYNLCLKVIYKKSKIGLRHRGYFSEPPPPLFRPGLKFYAFFLNLSLRQIDSTFLGHFQKFEWIQKYMQISHGLVFKNGLKIALATKMT